MPPERIFLSSDEKVHRLCLEVERLRTENRLLRDALSAAVKRLQEELDAPKVTNAPVTGN